ncbi:hypothetical protein PYW07_006026 [Mythimna separata]|uniref:Uncharacterized protein n=1 Tax=Mythimna separata TaxID=271217 RepID=A0AAD8DRV3_MYTSE|nr:hypothetical protein PYW07_006026 [Mythimna separata]
MDVKCYLGFIVLASTIASSSAGCILSQKYDSCNYTIICTSNPGSVTNPNCEEDPYVIFVIQNSNVEYLATGFFAATNFDSRVREIKTHGNSWSRIDTSAFRYYQKTITLDLSNNGIEKIYNEAFRNLNYLQTLNISHNKIETLNPKSFLTTDSRNNAVQELDLSYNKIIELSSELNDLPKLKILHLQNNMLSRLADDCFMSLKSLEYLNLQNNRLSFLNLTLTNLKMLKTLDISYNNLVKLSGYEINRMSAIVVFNASHNALTSVESNCFNQATALEQVDFSYNSINTTIENVRFVVNNQLQYLNFYNNHITGIQENSFMNCKLYYVNFENNNITGDIKENTLTGLHNVTKLDLSRQSISGIKDKAFLNMARLTHLNLSSNIIREIENSSFYNTSITVLDLSHNQVSDLYFLQNCLSNLIELYVSDNDITIVPKNSFDSQTQLKKLDLSMNRIVIIEQYSLPLNNLQYFNIENNRLSGVIEKNVFSPAKYLRFLNLSNFNITKIDDSAFVDLPVLARLNLSNNNIETIEPNNFRGVDNMYSLDLSHNNLTQLTFNKSIWTNNLKALYLNNNKLTNISKLFENTCRLSYLDISNNDIADLTALGADIFPNLTGLHIANNKIKNFNNPRTNSLTTLIDLGLSSNEINDINLSYYKELMSVDLSNNKLFYLNSTLFRNNEYLQSLDVSRNNITDVPPGTFQFMKNLKLVNLSSNYLTKLRFGSLKGLHKTELLDLSKNYIEVLDVDVFHECEEMKTLIIDYNRIKTFDVERLILMSLRKLRTLSLGGNPISCTEIVHNVKSTNVTFYAIRQVEITSINKVYHEDNVHGIQCGDVVYNESTTLKPNIKALTADTSTVSSTTVVLTWCSLLTILLVGAAVFAYMKLYKKRIFVVGSNVTMQMRNSIVSDGSDFQSDLLS